MIVRHLEKAYPDHPVLKGLSFQADPGEFIAIVGASGSGKTTLLRCLTLQESWDKGEYIYDGNNVLEGNPLSRLKIRRKWVFLKEDPGLTPKKTAIESVLEARWSHMPLWRKVIRKSSMDEHVYSNDFLEKVGLLDKGSEKVEKLSGGEKQRVALARALIQEAKMIAADDPVKGLDPQSVNRVMEDFRNVAKREKVLLVCAMQQLDLAERYATRIIGLSEGRIVMDIPARKLTAKEKELIL
ncbi:phosphonate ABC transporter ATP-binding protein [Gorillibacterium timonense]|uniref:phosphonate ABC transporter ATP-binding protein n=1 Tax=Gorillibacterium timonense TaxID=1689269 RepID=UPI00071D2391|nr:ATP-binding cassette domain-containing protein [Gorillibacterium timonense]